MSWSERSVRNHKRQTDRAIHCAFVQLAAHPSVLKKFHEILFCARKRAVRLFEAPFVNGSHLGIDALVHLSRFRHAHVRPVMDWAGTTSSWYPAISSLARHLICQYEVPMFLASSWYAADSTADQKRGWFIAYSHGASFRSLDLPIPLTRKMEHIFLASQDHMPMDQALRQAELRGLGASPEFVKAIMSTRLATDFRHSDFWRTVWIFFITNARNIEPEQIGPMIDYLQAIRHDRVAVETPNGTMELDPPHPHFSMKGRTVQSMLRLMQDWHRSLGECSTAASWTPSPFQPLLLEEPAQDASEVPNRWHMQELTNSTQLRREGAALHHCVASYATSCSRGISSIWSLRLWQREAVSHILTIEVDRKSRAVVQARGRANRPASGKPLRLLKDWALRERLRMTI